MDRVAEAVVKNKTRVIDLDLRAYFDNVRQDILLKKVAERVNDDKVMRLLINPANIYSKHILNVL